MSTQQGREKWLSRLIRIFNSTVCFSLAYIVITYSFWLVMGYVGKVYGFDAFVYYYGVKYLLNGIDWTRWNILVLYSSGSFFCLFLGLFCFLLFEKLKALNTMLNVFLLWCFLIGTCIFCAQSLIASLGVGEPLSPFYQNFAVVYAWWHVSPVIVYLLNIPFLLLFAFLAVNYAKPFSLLAYSYSKVNTEKRRKRFFIETVFVPFILGSGITSAVTFPMNIFIHAIYLMYIGAALVISWVSLTYIEIQKEKLLKYTGLQTINPLFLFLLILIIFFVYTGWKGINLS